MGSGNGGPAKWVQLDEDLDGAIPLLRISSQEQITYVCKDTHCFIDGTHQSS